MLRPLVGRALRTLDRVAAQSDDDGARFVRLGARPEQVSVLGNLKFDVKIDDAAQRTVAAFAEHVAGRPAWIAASTHPEEEEAVVTIHRRLRARWPDLVLLWAPRHPERFRPVTQACIEAGWRVATRKLTRWPDASDDVFVIDTLGELVHFYGCARVAFVGGSLQPVGGHNLLEPAAMGVAVVTGPHLHNFADIVRQMDEAGALRIGADADAVGAHLEELLADADARGAMVAQGLGLVKQGRGALARTLEMIGPALPPA